MKRDLSLDAIDIKILSAVQQYGQLSKGKLAELVDLSPTPCWVRLGKLKDAGLIRHYRADISLSRLIDLTQAIVTVSLTQHRKTDFDRFEQQIRLRSEITECIATGGGVDYVLKVYCANMAKFQQLMDSLLEAEIGIERYMTYIVTREIKSEPPDLAELIHPAKK